MSDGMTAVPVHLVSDDDRSLALCSGEPNVSPPPDADTQACRECIRIALNPDPVTPCAMSNRPIFVNLTAACPDCGHMVKVRLVNHVWCFVAHGQGGEEETEPSLWAVGDRVIVAPSGREWTSGTVTAVDEPGRPKGVRVQFDQPVIGVDNCYASHDELRRAGAS